MLSYPCYIGEFFHFTGYNRITLPECFILTKNKFTILLHIFVYDFPCFRLDGECGFTFTTFFVLCFSPVIFYPFFSEINIKHIYKIDTTQVIA